MNESSKSIEQLSSQEKRNLLAQIIRDKKKEYQLPFPLSYAQQSMWFEHQFAPESWAYNIIFTATILSPLNVSALRKSIQALLDRHPSLRTTFSLKDNEPIQQIHEHTELDFKHIDAFAWTLNETKDELLSEARIPFNLEFGPLLRVRLYTLSPGKHVFLLAAHHIAIDFWSIITLLKELSIVYSSYKSGIESLDLPPLKAQYLDFVKWQNELVVSDKGRELWTYWQKQLGGLLPILDMPTDYPRPVIRSFRGDWHKFKIDEQLTLDLKEIARIEGVTLYVLLLAAFQVLLNRYSGQEDILIGTYTFGRSQVKFESTMGYFVNPIVLRANLSGDPTFRDFLKQVRQTVLMGLKHQDYPFSLLVKRLNLDRFPGVSPLFQVSFSFRKTQDSELDQVPLFLLGESEYKMNLGELTLEPIDIPQMEGQDDLGLDVSEVGEMLHISLSFSTDLFENSTIEKMGSHFQCLLKNIVANSSNRVSLIPLLTNEEKITFTNWNNTEVEYHEDLCIHKLFEKQVVLKPNHIAVEFEAQQLNYKELNSRANQLGRYLQDLGVGSEVPVGIYLKNSLEMIVAIMAVLKVGGVCTPLDPTYPKERLYYIVKDSHVKVILSHQELVKEFLINDILLVDVDNSWDIIAEKSTENICISNISSSNLAYILYTSGSMGQPKGVLMTHLQVSNRILWGQSKFLTETDRVLQTASLGFNVAIWEIFLPLLTGARLILTRFGGNKDCSYLVTVIKNREITFIDVVPSLLKVLLQERGFRECSSLKNVVCGGETLSIELCERFSESLNADLHNLYGSTEVSGDAISWTYQSKNENSKVLIGRPNSNVQAYILSEHLQHLPIGVVGELYIGGFGLARGYLNNPELTAEKFVPNPFSEKPGERLYKTGDLARFLHDGNIEYLGRGDNQVNIRGFRIELSEIEAAINNHQDINDNIVIVREDTPGEHRLVAYLVPNSSTPNVRELRDFLRAKLPSNMVPSSFVFLPSLPLNCNGKVDQKSLPKPGIIRSDLDSGYVAPRTSIEEKLLQIWSKLLDVGQIGIEDDFFVLGGHSLLVVQLISQIREICDVELPVQKIFEASTIASLAKIIEEVHESKHFVSTTANFIETLIDEVVLDDSIHSDNLSYTFAAKSRNVLLTGSSGFLGAFLLHELLQQTEVNVYCLVRAKSDEEGMERIINNLKAYSLWLNSFSSRITLIRGDLSLPRLGLTDQEFNSLSNSVDTIYHNGALVNLIYPYSALKAVNVFGTHEILRLASLNGLKPVHFISSLSVCTALGSSAEIVKEEDRLEHFEFLHGGYSQSKWVAEKILAIGQSRGIPISIYRPGTIAGHSKTGISNKNDFLNTLLKGFIQSGVAPDLDGFWDMTPVDYVSKAVIHLSRQEKMLGKTFHIVDSHPLRLKTIINWIRSFGYPIKQVPYGEWREKFSDYDKVYSDIGLSSLSPLFPSTESSEKVNNSLQILNLKFDCSNTIRGLDASSIHCPPANSELLHKYLLSIGL